MIVLCIGRYLLDAKFGFKAFQEFALANDITPIMLRFLFRCSQLSFSEKSQWFN